MLALKGLAHLKQAALVGNRSRHSLDDLWNSHIYAWAEMTPPKRSKQCVLQPIPPMAKHSMEQ